MSVSAPTQKQYDVLRNLGGGAAGLSRKKRETEVLLRRGWVTAEWHAPYYQWVRITPDGLRSLALGVEKFGLPEIGPKPQRGRYAALDKLAALTPEEPTPPCPECRCDSENDLHSAECSIGRAPEEPTP